MAITSFLLLTEKKLATMDAELWVVSLVLGSNYLHSAVQMGAWIIIVGCIESVRFRTVQHRSRPTQHFHFATSGRSQRIDHHKSEKDGTTVFS